jgi:hypothetical protein
MPDGRAITSVPLPSETTDIVSEALARGVRSSGASSGTVSSYNRARITAGAVGDKVR